MAQQPLRQLQSGRHITDVVAVTAHVDAPGPIRQQHPGDSISHGYQGSQCRCKGGCDSKHSSDAEERLAPDSQSGRQEED
jgi:hypothetical protein